MGAYNNLTRKMGDNLWANLNEWPEINWPQNVITIAEIIIAGQSSCFKFKPSFMANWLIAAAT